MGPILLAFVLNYAPPEPVEQKPLIVCDDGRFFGAFTPGQLPFEGADQCGLGVDKLPETEKDI